MTNALVGNRYRPANFLARRSTRAAGTAAFRVRDPRWRDGRIGPIADFDHPKPPALVPKERTIKVPSDAKRKRLENLYAQVRKIRESKTGYERLGEIWETQQAEHPEDWLLSMEIFEILDTTNEQPELKSRIEKFLSEKKAQTKDLTTLISWGFRLVEYHKKPEFQAALHASPK